MKIIDKNRAGRWLSKRFIQKPIKILVCFSIVAFSSFAQSATTQLTSIPKTPAPVQISSLVPTTQQQTPLSPEKKQDPVLEAFNKTLNQATALIKELFELIKKFPELIKGVSFSASTTISFFGNATKQLGFVFYLNHPGYGDSLGAYQGFIIDVRLDALPGVFGVAFTNLSKELLKNILMGSTTRDQASGLVTLRSNPLFEFFLRLALLVKDRPTMSGSVFSANLFKLMVRFVSTPGLTDPYQALSQLPPFLAPILNSIKLGDKTAYEYLSLLLQDMSDVFNYDFSQEDDTELDVKDMPDIIKIALAIGAKAAIEYSKAYQAFVQTPQGIAAIKMAKASNKENIFYKQIPELEMIKSNMLARAAALVQRFKQFRIVRDKIIEAIAPALNPVLKDLFGITLEDLFPRRGTKKVEQISASDEALLAQVDALLGQDAMLSAPEAGETLVAGTEEVEIEVPNVEEHVKATLINENLVPVAQEADEEVDQASDENVEQQESEIPLEPVQPVKKAILPNNVGAVKKSKVIA